ncbi:response regulator [Clostridium sp. DJ247]|uniref:hybrid sensor histidine kinase/response regulator n=1 Tax=Clostridium sp. DJ247 TaxID=2726188 RepID=UPI00162A8F1D|nr:response regulator [Clostridium sp. DJ247]MBC2581454.1 response regulator [Clostridium sp. DJ247]
MNINDAEFFKKLRSTFNIEAHEHLRTISLSMIELEKEQIEDRKSVIETIHREFHSLKGAARSVNIREIETICHNVENIFSNIKKGKSILSSEMFDILNKAVDTIEDILSLSDSETKDISIVIEELKKIESKNLKKEVFVEIDNTEKVDLNIEDQIDIKNNISMNNSLNIGHKDIQAQDMNSIKDIENKTRDTVRVSKSKLDSLLLQGEEMLYAKLSTIQRTKEIKNIKELLYLWKKENDYAYIEILENNLDHLIKAAEDDERTIEAMMDTFMEDIKDMMLLPFSSIIEMFPKMIRDLSRQIGKEVEFISNGMNIEIDRRILEEIKIPIMHIIRNCIDHGIETVEERKRLEKPSKGRISINVTEVSGNRVKIEISDDGSGVDVNKLKQKAVKNKILTQAEVDIMDDENAQRLIFKSGISTSDIITDISGRGLGLAIVHEKIQKLEGLITVQSEKQKGITFVIILPITISTNRGIIVKVEKQTFIIPTSKVEKVIRIKRDEIKVIENNNAVIIDNCIIPIVYLTDILEIQEYESEYILNNSISILVVNNMEKRIAFAVDEVVIEQEVLVKRFNKQLKRVRNISGATILGSGEVVPILDVQDLIKSSIKYGNKASNIIKNRVTENIEKKSIIVVDDSITSRTLLKNILETHGYLVKTAVDGLQGWTLLKNERFDMVITDVEMPVMDGFELTKKIRMDSELSEIPVILVTSLKSMEHKERGIDVGASAYIVKSDFQQSNLLEIIKRLI